jgi:hypothetical protein
MLARKALAGTAGAPKEYVEDVFSTYLYTGTGSTLSINNGIDLSGEGGMVWIKARSTAYIHCLYDTQRGALQTLTSNTTDASVSESGSLTAFNADGFTLGSFSQVNHSSNPTYVSWTFRKAKKFFDVVTYTGNGSPRNISHNLGSAPGCVIVKRTSSTGSWAVWHRSGNQTNGKYAAYLDDTGAYTDQATNLWGSESAAPDMNSSTFGVGTAGAVNSNGFTYVAYLFAHDAGGFGDAGSDSIIKCGSYTGTRVDLGWEPQWIMYKRSDSTGNWVIVDNMRGVTSEGNNAMNYVLANTSGAEVASSGTFIDANGWGFTGGGAGATTYIYIAIRRGPMKTPTSGTSVFSPVASSASTGTTLTTNFPIDMQLSAYLSGYSNNTAALDRLRGISSTTTETVVRLTTSSTGAESATGIASRNWSNTGFEMPSALGGGSSIFWNFRRAPGFFDVVCYTGTGSATTVTHNLGVAPELMIVKCRSSGSTWRVYSAGIGNTKSLALNAVDAPSTGSWFWNNTSPTSSVFSVGTDADVNGSGSTYVAYLFASLSGISKVGTYTGNGSSQTINCGFTAGARFILIKRTDDTGDWYVYDSARGIVSGNDPQLKLNSTAAEATGYDAVDPDNSGFIVNNDATNFPINVNTATYIYLAIA